MKNKTKRKKLISIISIIALSFLIIFCALLIIANSKKVRAISNDRDVSSVETLIQSPLHDNDKEDEYTELMGFGCLDINKDYPYLNLINPSSNDVYLSFDVMNNDEILYKSNLIRPGMMEQFNIYSCLNAGEHTITYSINSYDLNSEEPLWSGIKQNQDIYITK